MNFVIQHMIFFAVGFLQDLLITFYYQSIAKEYSGKAAVLSVVVTLVNLLVLYEILTGLESQVISVIMAYAVGNGVGTYYVVNRQKKK
jgi:uncharacterized protein YebE (UPF0316 family)